MIVEDPTTAVGAHVPVKPDTVATVVLAGSVSAAGKVTVIVEARAVEIVPVGVKPMS